MGNNVRWIGSCYNVDWVVLDWGLLASSIKFVRLATNNVNLVLPNFVTKF